MRVHRSRRVMVCPVLGFSFMPPSPKQNATLDSADGEPLTTRHSPRSGYCNLRDKHCAKLAYLRARRIFLVESSSRTVGIMSRFSARLVPGKVSVPGGQAGAELFEIHGYASSLVLDSLNSRIRRRSKSSRSTDRPRSTHNLRAKPPPQNLRFHERGEIETVVIGRSRRGKTRSRESTYRRRDLVARVTAFKGNRHLMQFRVLLAGTRTSACGAERK